MIKIIKAIYRSSEHPELQKDVTDIVQQIVRTNQLLRVSNQAMNVDPAKGQAKELVIYYTNYSPLNKETITTTKSFIHEEILQEFSFIYLPEIKTNRLGIPYTNATEDPQLHCLKSVLQELEKLQDLFIITSVWQSVPTNTFLEIQSPYKVLSNQNIAFQILQLLGIARNLHNFKYVSFLEHDVLYSQSHFDFQDFDEEYIVNENHIGMEREGFTSKGLSPTPLFAQTLQFNFALEHFSQQVLNYITHPEKNYEDIGNEPNLAPHLKYSSKDPIIHVNHGAHFTSHFETYPKDNLHQVEPYWGSFEMMKEIFV